MRLLLFLLFSLSLTYASADIIIDVDTLYISRSADSCEASEIYRIEITNKTDSEYLFFISPTHCIHESVKNKFKEFLRQDVGGGWRMIHIIYEGNMIYNPKSYSENNLLKIIPPKQKFILFVLHNHYIESVLNRLTMISMAEVKKFIKHDLRRDIIYPYSEAIWPSAY